MTGPIDSTVLWLTWRQLFARRRLYLAAAFSLAPLLIARGFRFTSSDLATLLSQDPETWGALSAVPQTARGRE